MITVFLITPPFHIGNGVALKKESASFLELRKTVSIATNSGGMGAGFLRLDAVAESCATRNNDTVFNKITSIHHLGITS
jgi:hypothetical protein